MLCIRISASITLQLSSCKLLSLILCSNTSHSLGWSRPTLLRAMLWQNMLVSHGAPWSYIMANKPFKTPTYIQSTWILSVTTRRTSWRPPISAISGQRNSVVASSKRWRKWSPELFLLYSRSFMLTIRSRWRCWINSGQKANGAWVIFSMDMNILLSSQLRH